MKPRMMTAKPFIRTGWGNEQCGEGRRNGLTPITDTASLFRTGIEHGGDDHESGGDGTFTDAK